MITRVRNAGILLPLTMVFVLTAIFWWEAHVVRGLAGHVSDLQKELAALQQSSGRRGLNPDELGNLSVASLMDDLTQLGRRHGVEMTSIQPGEPQVKEGHLEQTIHLETEGRYRDIGDYLAELEVFQKPVKITSLKMEVSSSGLELISATLELMLYRRSPQ